MTELTKWLQNTITGIETVVDDKSFVCDEIVFKIDVVKNVLTAFKVALASLEAEPVAWLHSDNGLGIPAITRSKNVADSWLSKGWYVQPLYIAQSMPIQEPPQEVK